MVNLALKDSAYTQLINEGLKPFSYYEDDVKQICDSVEELYSKNPQYKDILEVALFETIKFKMYREELCPKVGDYYYVVSLEPLIEVGKPRYEQKEWLGSLTNFRELELGLAYRTEELASTVSNGLINKAIQQSIEHRYGDLL